MCRKKDSGKRIRGGRNMRHETIYLYEGRRDVSLTTYVLDDSGEMLNGKKRPAVLVCPGGAYLGCSDREGEPIAMAFAMMGYHAFVLRYSTYGWDEFRLGLDKMKVKPECVYPAPMREIGMAMKYIKEHEEEWLVDKERVAICGFSAGAHNCAMYATHWHMPVVTEFFGLDKEVFRPAACILGYCLSDYTYMEEYTLDDAGAVELFHGANISYLGTKDVTKEQLEMVSPVRFVTDETPPTFLWATAADELVPVQHTIRMAHALADGNVPFEVHIFEEGSHGLALATHATSAGNFQMDADAEKWLGLADAWLRKRFSIFGKEEK